MKKSLLLWILTCAAAISAYGDGGMMAGSGMMVVADDASLLVTNMSTGGMMNGGSVSTADRELVNIDANGNERWRVSFEDGWPMMPVTYGDLVVVVLADDWFMGFDGMGDGDWNGGMGGGMKNAGHGPEDDETVLVALDLATGQERWRATVPGDTGSMVHFSDDGTRLYVSARQGGTGEHIGPGSMRQGQAAGAGFMMSTTIVTFDRSGNQLWTYDLGGE